MPADSLQTGDEPASDARLDRFPRQFHEPFHRHCLREAPGALLRGTGFDPEPARLAFLTKIVVAQRR